MKKRILLADDDESVRKMVGRVLESAGYAVIPARSGEEAVAGFQVAKPDLVVWDLEMPTAGGWERLGANGKPGPSVPVVATTAWPTQDERTLHRGLSALMEKPLDLPLLLKTIQELLTLRELGDAQELAAAS